MSVSLVPVVQARQKSNEREERGGGYSGNFKSGCCFLRTDESGSKERHKHTRTHTHAGTCTHTEAQRDKSGENADSWCPSRKAKTEH